MITATDLPRVAQAFLTAERIGESGGDYWILCGGRPNDPATPHWGAATPRRPGYYGFPVWAGWVDPNSGAVSHAAGADQFEPDTWHDTAAMMEAAGMVAPDFANPIHQDWGGWTLAKKDYRRKSGGRDLATDLASGDPAVLANVAVILKSTWTSLSADTFAERFNNALAVAVDPVQPAPAPTPAPPPEAPAPTPIPSPQASGGQIGILASGITGALAIVIQWACTWPIQAPKEAQATALASLAVALAGYLFHRKATA